MLTHILKIIKIFARNWFYLFINILQFKMSYSVGVLVGNSLKTEFILFIQLIFELKLVIAVL